MSEKIVLIKIADGIDDILNNGNRIKGLMKQCQIDEPPMIVQIELPSPVIYAVVEHTECVEKQISSNALEYMSQEEYERIYVENNDSITEIEMEEEDGGEHCTII